MKKIILASKSPRRKELLNLIGVNFEIHAGSWIEEEQKEINLIPQELCKYNALQKARAVNLFSGEDYIVIGCDTIVVSEDKILGKPASRKKAVEMLNLLSGKRHMVYSGLAVRDNKSGREIVECVETKVTFRELTPLEIDSYVKTDEPMDKAGAYGIQGKGALLVEKIEGCYYNVVGLPLSTLYKILTDLGINVWG